MRIIKSFSIIIEFLLPKYKVKIPKSILHFGLLLLVAILFSSKVTAQSNFITLGDKQYNFIERMDIKLVNDSVLRFTTTKPYNRNRVTLRIEYIDSLYKSGSTTLSLSKTDKYNMQDMLQNNADVTAKNQLIPQHKMVLGLFAMDQHAYFARTNNYTLVVDPVLNLEGGYSTSINEPRFFNTRGMMIRGMVDKKISFWAYLSDNQERDPQYVIDYTNNHNSTVSGQGFTKVNASHAYDYFNSRAGISFNMGKYFDLVFAYDKLSVGNGYRSLFLSDNSSSYPYLRFVTHFGRINYEATIAQTYSLYTNNVRFLHTPAPVNYLAIHHISMQLTKRLNIGLYENSMEKGSDGFKIGYLNPVIFYKAIEQDYGTAGKTNIGIDFKENAFKNFQFYGQLLFNEFHFKDILHYSQGAFTNKQALQLGVKYIDAFAIKDFDLQFETNLIRPYTYMNYDSTTNFTNYNQPLAHPLGANCREFIFIAKFQPSPRLNLTGKLFYYEQGLDLKGLNYGSNLLETYNTRPGNYGFFIGSGQLAKCLLTSLNVAYELKSNLFLEANISNRGYKLEGASDSNERTYMLGFRWNIARRDFEF